MLASLFQDDFYKSMADPKEDWFWHAVFDLFTHE
jgi:hypothetical protein